VDAFYSHNNEVGEEGSALKILDLFCGAGGHQWDCIVQGLKLKA